MQKKQYSCSIFLLCLLLGATASAIAATKERTQFSQDIRLEAGDEAGEVTCIACSIHVRGKVTGDATAFFGRIVVEPGGSISGDAAAILGDIRIDDGGAIGGDVSAIGGTLHRAPGAIVGGEATSAGSRPAMLVVLLSPLLVLAGVIFLILWLLQRNRQNHAPAAQGYAAPSTVNPATRR